MTTGHSWARCQSERRGKEIREKERNRETLSHSFRTAYTRALTGSARGKACGQALAGSLGPRGTARASTILQI